MACPPARHAEAHRASQALPASDPPARIGPPDSPRGSCHCLSAEGGWFLRGILEFLIRAAQRFAPKLSNSPVNMGRAVNNFALSEAQAERSSELGHLGLAKPGCPAYA